jgi:tRNA 2-selenouridine synthase
MAINKITIDQFLLLRKRHPVLDVRSPGEYLHAHLPGAYNLPLFSDEERKIVGTAYKQQGKEKAIKAGLDFFGTRMRAMVEMAESFYGTHYPAENKTGKTGSAGKKTMLVHCWRGGMRSAGVAWLLDLYGFEVYVLTGGYKAYRNFVLEQFEKDYDIKILGGYTGSGKTALLGELKKKGNLTIDLEALASHRGSAFGGIGQPKQPTQEMFENKLADALMDTTQAPASFWLEDESQRIGVLNIPHPFWNTMRRKPVYFVEISFEERLKHIIDIYGNLHKESLLVSVLRIQKRLGPLETKTCIALLEENNTREAFRILLKYYDKTYEKSLYKRENSSSLLNKIPLLTVDSIVNAEKLLACLTVNI